MSDGRLEEMIRVDHAGEHGAVRIYDGQLAVFDKIPGFEKTASRPFRRPYCRAQHTPNGFWPALECRGICPWRRNGTDGREGCHGLHRRRGNRN